MISMGKQVLVAVFFVAVFYTVTGQEVGDKNIEYGQLDNVTLNLDLQFSAQGEACDIGMIGDRGDNCVTLSWDNDDVIDMTFSTPEGPLMGETPTAVEIRRCFSAPQYTKNRAWRKPKDVIRKDKQCAKIGTVDVSNEKEMTFSYTIPSDAAEATYFIKLLVKCGSGKYDYCGLDDTNEGMKYAIEPMDSIPPGLVVGVIIAIILAPTFLISYFVYEFGFAKRA